MDNFPPRNQCLLINFTVTSVKMSGKHLSLFVLLAEITFAQVRDHFYKTARQNNKLCLYTMLPLFNLDWGTEKKRNLIGNTKIKGEKRRKKWKKGRSN